VSVLPFPRRTREVTALRWVVRVFLEAVNGHQHDVTGARFDTEAEATEWAVAELDRLRVMHAGQLGGPDCRCYVAAVRAPGGWKSNKPGLDLQTGWGRGAEAELNAAELPPGCRTRSPGWWPNAR